MFRVHTDGTPRTPRALQHRHRDTHTATLGAGGHGGGCGWGAARRREGAEAVGGSGVEGTRYTGHGPSALHGGDGACSPVPPGDVTAQRDRAHPQPCRILPQLRGPGQGQGVLSRWDRAAPGSPHTSRPALRRPGRAEPLGACGIIAEPQHGAAAPCGAGCSLLLPTQPTDGWKSPQNSAGLLHQGDGAQRWHHHAPALGSPPGFGQGDGGSVPALLRAPGTALGLSMPCSSRAQAREGAGEFLQHHRGAPQTPGGCSAPRWSLGRWPGAGWGRAAQLPEANRGGTRAGGQLLPVPSPITLTAQER